jgi:hypothetical protein
MEEWRIGGPILHSSITPFLQYCTIESEDEHDWEAGVIPRAKKTALHPAGPASDNGRMTWKQWSGVLVLCAAATAIFLASCSGNQTVAQPTTHQMVGTNGPGY